MINQLSQSLLFSVGISSLFPNSPFEITHLAVPTDIAVFTLAIIQNQIMKSMNRGTSRSNILDTVSRDAGIYFALITVSHFLVLVMYLTARVKFSSLVFESDRY